MQYKIYEHRSTPRTPITQLAHNSSFVDHVDKQILMN